MKSTGIPTLLRAMTRASAFSLLQKRTQARTRQCELSILRDPSQSVFAQCMAWAPRLNTFLELKMENERLQHCIHELRAQKGQFVQTPSTSTVPALMASTLPPVFGSNPPSTVTKYCTRVLSQFKRNSSSISPLEIQPPEMAGTGNTLLPLHDPRLRQNSSRWVPGTWKQVVIATTLVLGLQWGTAGAAVMIHYIAPPVGLGCRALSYLLYSAVGTLSFFLFLASSILAHMSRPLQGQIYARPWLRTCQNVGAIICRWLGKCVAIISAMGTLLVYFFQNTGAFNNCFCSSVTFDKGRHPVVIRMITYIALEPGVIRTWAGGLAFTFSAALFFSFSMYLDSPPCR